MDYYIGRKQHWKSDIFAIDSLDEACWPYDSGKGMIIPKIKILTCDLLLSEDESSKR